jgi:hypothetical protein
VIHEAPNEIDSGGPALLSPWKETAAAASAAALAYAFGHLLTRDERELMARSWKTVIGDPEAAADR